MGKNSLRGISRIDIGYNFIQYFFGGIFLLVVKDVNVASYANNTIYKSGRN